MDQRRQLPVDVLADIADSHTARDAAIARADLEAAHHEHLRMERDEARRLLDEAHIRNYQEADEASAIAAALTKERDAAVSSCQQNSAMLFQARQERDHYKSIATLGVVVTDFEAMRKRATEAEALLSETISDAQIVESMVTERIAKWLEKQEPGFAQVVLPLAAAIRAGSHTKESR